MLHHRVAQIADDHRETSHRTVWTAEHHERWVAGPVRDVRSTATLTGPIETHLDRVLTASLALIGVSLPMIGPHAEHNDPGILPLVDVDDLVGRWLDALTGGAGRHWVSAMLDQTPADPFTGLYRAASVILSMYLRIVDIDRRFVPVLATFAAIRRGSVEPSGPDPLVAELGPLAELGDRFFDGEECLRAAHPRRVGVVAPFALTDSGHGAPAAIRGTVSALSLRNEVEVVCTVAQPTLDAGIARQRRITEVPRPTQQRSWRRIRLLAGALKGCPPWAFEWRSPDFTTAVSSLIARCDVTHVEFVLLADDVPADSRGVIVVDHDPPVASALLQLRHDPWTLRPFRVVEIQAWARAHRRAGKRATIVVVFAGEDKRIVERFVRSTPVVVAPLGIVLPVKALDPVGSGPHTIAFMGSYRRHPNVDALRRLVDGIMPLVWAQRPETQLLIVGPEPPAWLTTSDVRIATTGYVDDVGDVLDDVAVFAAPVRLGHGMRVKTLEALAWGKAVVTTSKGAAGLPEAARRCMVVVDDDAEFAAEVIRLLDDPARRSRLASAGRAWAEEWLHEERVADRFENLHDLVDAIVESGER